jgi:hypothetical protein
MMKMQEFFKELNEIVKEELPAELCFDEAMCDRCCLTIGWVLTFMKLSFAIDKIEWEGIKTTKMKRRLVKHRALDALLELKEYVDKAIIKCGGTI